jgi:hypothetical protein
MARQLISEKMTFLWLSRGDLKGEHENEITAAQDQALQTKCHATKILQTKKKTAIADSVNNLMRQCNISHQYAHYCKRTVHKETQ